MIPEVGGGGGDAATQGTESVEYQVGRYFLVVDKPSHFFLERSDQRPPSAGQWIKKNVLNAGTAGEYRLRNDLL